MKQLINKTLPLILIAIPVIVFWYWFFAFAVDAPMWDDFVLTDFMLRLNENPSFSEKLRLFFAQHNAHRIVYDRVITYLVWLLTGKMDFRLMMLIGNLSLMGLLGLFWKVFRTEGLSAWQFVPVPMLLLTMQGYENTYWAMAALQNYTVLFFVLTSLHCLAVSASGSQAGKNFTWAIILAILATFTSGNGQMTFFIGILLLIYQRQWRKLSVWCLAMFPTLGLYFWGYNRLPQELFTSKFFINFFAFNGAAFADSDQYKIAMMVGIVVFVWLAGIFSWKVLLPLLNKHTSSAKSSLGVQAWFVFLCITSLLVAASHLKELPIHETLVSRYKIYSHLFLIISYLWLLILLKNHWRTIATALSIVFGLGFEAAAYYQFFDDMSYRNRDLIITGFNVKHNGTCLMGISHAAAADSVYRKLEAKGLYELPQEIDFPEQIVQPTQIGLNVEEVQRKLLYFTPLVKTLAISNDDYLPLITAPQDGAFVVLRSPTKTFVFNTHQNQNGKKGFFTGGGYYRAGFFTEIHKPLLPPDAYRVGLLVIENGKSRLELTHQQVKVQENELVE